MNHQAASSTDRPDGEQAVVLEDGALGRPHGGPDAIPFVGVEDHAVELVVQPVVLVEVAGVLGDGVELAPQGRPGLAVGRMRVGGGDHVGTGGVDPGVDGEGGPVERALTLDDLALVIDEEEVRGLDGAEVLAQAIHPEAVGVLGITGGDVAGHPFVEAVLGEDAEGGGEPLLAVQALVLDRRAARDTGRARWWGRR